MIEAKLFGDQGFLTLLGRMTGDIAPQVEQGMLRSLIRLQRLVKQEKLSGQVLHVRTGTLRRSINQKILSSGGGEIVGAVGTNVSYGKMWEYGFTQKTGAGARGGPRTLTGNALATYFQQHPPGTKHVPERSFLRSALAEFLPEFRREMQDAVHRSIGR